MSGVVAWEAKTVSEKVLRYADFADELVAGDQLMGVPTCAVTVWSGNDVALAIVAGVGLLLNTAGILTLVAVTLQNGVLGTIYQCVVSCGTVNGLTLTKTATLVVKPPLN